MGHARACSPKRAELNPERSTPPSSPCTRSRARTFRRTAQLGGGNPALPARRVVRSAKGPIRMLCMPHPTLSGCRSSSARRLSEPMAAGAMWRGRQQMVRSASLGARWLPKTRSTHKCSKPRPRVRQRHHAAFTGSHVLIRMHAPVHGPALASHGTNLIRASMRR